MERRECGSCSLCCKLLSVEELEKPTGKWCPKISEIGKGCPVYTDRPESCRAFDCMWLLGWVKEDMSPLKTKTVAHYKISEHGHTVFLNEDVQGVAEKHFGGYVRYWKQHGYSVVVNSKNGQKVI